MPFREKSAWISLVCLLATFGVFYALLIGGRLGDHPLEHLHWFLIALAAFMLLQLVLHVVARVLAPLDAKAPVDERERLIRLKASRNAYLTLFACAVLIPLSLHLPRRLHAEWTAAPWIALGGLFIAEVVRAMSQIVYFRRGP